MKRPSGPVPVRMDQRVRRNKPDVPVTKVPAIGVIPIPELGMADPHPLVKDLYQSLIDSAQSNFYEASDWSYARLALHFVDRLLKATKPSSEMLATVNSMLTGLLMTEGDRRRVRMEIERKPTADPSSEGATVADMFAARLGVPRTA